jgi:hypothetical protein
MYSFAKKRIGPYIFCKKRKKNVKKNTLHDAIFDAGPENRKRQINIVG